MIGHTVMYKQLSAHRIAQQIKILAIMHIV